MLRYPPFHRRSTRAFTLVELLVVIAIIGILVALLLPAIQAAREAARRSQCTNNLKQLALGTHNYHDVHRSFPSGFMYEASLRGATGRNHPEMWAWGTLLLPYIEQGSLHDQMNVTGQTLSRLLAAGLPAAALAQTPLKVFLCPSDPGGGDIQWGLTHPTRHWGGRTGVTAGGLGDFVPGGTSYVANGGVDDRFDEDRGNILVWPGPIHSRFAVKMAKIHDGTSNTALIGERDIAECRGGVWVGVGNADQTNLQGVFTAIGNGDRNVKLNSPASVTSTDGCSRGFASMHPGGASFALCDASVRFVSENIHFVSARTVAPNLPNGGTYQRLLAMNDGYPLGEF